MQLQRANLAGRFLLTHKRLFLTISELLAYILQDQDLRDYVGEWGKDRREAGIDDKPPQLKHNDHYERVVKMAIKCTNRRKKNTREH
jgi:hypothetical protein